MVSAMDMSHDKMDMPGKEMGHDKMDMSGMDMGHGHNDAVNQTVASLESSNKDNKDDAGTEEQVDCYKVYGPEFMDCWTGLEWDCCVADDDDAYTGGVKNELDFDFHFDNTDDGTIHNNNHANPDNIHFDDKNNNGLTYNETLTKADILVLRNFVVYALVAYLVITGLSRLCCRSATLPPIESASNDRSLSDFDEDDDEYGEGKDKNVELQALL